MNKELQKKLSFVLFVMAVFFAGVALTVLRSSVITVCIAGVLLLGATVYFVLMQEKETQSPTEKTSELLFADRMAELMRGNEKAEKGVYLAVKKQHEAMEAGLASLEAKLTEMVQAQENAVKTIVLYNKENAKQMALSERDELMKLREAWSQQSKNGQMSSVVDAIKEMSHRLYEEQHESGEAILSELRTAVDNLEEMMDLISSIGENGLQVATGAPVTSMPKEEPMPAYEQEPAEEEPVVEPEPVVEVTPVAADPNAPLSQDDIAALFAQMDTAEEVVEEAVEEPVPEPVVEVTPIAADPNAPLSADDIAALFAQAEAASAAPTEEEPVAEPEPVAEKTPEDAFASSGVDLSDPNKQLSADDIAALFAAMGN